jgi:RNA polymerase sigma-70 factor (ECF subfamily)
VHFYNSYKNDVYNYLLAKVRGNADAAADLFGEVNIEVLACLGKLKRKDNLLGWVLRIAHNVYCDHVKKTVKNDKLIKSIKDYLMHNPKDEYDEIDKETKDSLVGTAIKNLNEKNRRIVNLKYFEHKSIKELAQIFNTTENVICGMLIRAKMALKKEIQKLDK